MAIPIPAHKHHKAYPPPQVATTFGGTSWRWKLGKLLLIKCY